MAKAATKIPAYWYFHVFIYLEEILLVVELCASGSLESFLANNKSNFEKSRDDLNGYIADNGICSNASETESDIV